MPLPNVIIAGPPKAGTTSIFRYLATHPDVCASSIKEIHFFENNTGIIDQVKLREYESYFKSCDNDTTIRLEASPRYMQGGTPIASTIHQHLPDAKLIFVIREPIERFISRYISLVTKTDRIPEEYHNLDKLIDSAIAHHKANPDPDEPSLDDEIVEYLWQGCYADFINRFIDIHGKENVDIVFFDDLKHTPASFMEHFCKIIGIDSGHYADYQFRVENKTRVVKHRALHKIAERLNRKLEFIQNKYPKIRQLIKTVYYSMLNPESKGNDICDTTYARSQLEQYYNPHNDRLREMLNKHYPALDLPGWLK